MESWPRRHRHTELREEAEARAEGSLMLHASQTHAPAVRLLTRVPKQIFAITWFRPLDDRKMPDAGHVSQFQDHETPRLRREMTTSCCKYVPDQPLEPTLALARQGPLSNRRYWGDFIRPGHPGSLPALATAAT